MGLPRSTYYDAPVATADEAESHHHIRLNARPRAVFKPDGWR